MKNIEKQLEEFKREILDDDSIVYFYLDYKVPSGIVENEVVKHPNIPIWSGWEDYN